jgi:hypothetical protein
MSKVTSDEVCENNFSKQLSTTTAPAASSTTSRNSSLTPPTAITTKSQKNETITTSTTALPAEIAHALRLPPLYLPNYVKENRKLLRFPEVVRRQCSDASAHVYTIDQQNRRLLGTNKKRNVPLLSAIVITSSKNTVIAYDCLRRMAPFQQRQL